MSGQMSSPAPLGLASFVRSWQLQSTRRVSTPCIVADVASAVTGTSASDWRPRARGRSPQVSLALVGIAVLGTATTVFGEDCDFFVSEVRPILE